jgi:tetratricopeptide (TPR) repeat protein
MSKVFKTLADKVLPELRRARFIANVDYSNYNDEELVELTKTNIEIMDVEALLYSATLVKDFDAKVKIYTKAGEKFKDDRAYNNLTATYLDNGKLPEAKMALAKIGNKTSKYYYNNAGIIALRDNNLKGAAEMFKKSDLQVSKQNLAIIDILEGRYNDAVAKLAGTGDDNEGIAYILTNQLDKASKAITHMCPHAAYMRAVIAARQGNMTEVAKQLDIVYSKSEALKLRSQKDIEFAKFRE